MWVSQVVPPFDEDQVEFINAYQLAAEANPFTCDKYRCRRVLIAATDDLKCPGCGFRFSWVWPWVANGSWRSSGVASPLDGWWRRYPVRGTGWIPQYAGPDDRPDPRFVVGAVVQLRGKPHRARRVLSVEWHHIRGTFSYLVETTAPAGFRPYWFAEQLILVNVKNEQVATPKPATPYRASSV